MDFLLFPVTELPPFPLLLFLLPFCPFPDILLGKEASSQTGAVDDFFTEVIFPTLFLGFEADNRLHQNDNTSNPTKQKLKLACIKIYSNILNAKLTSLRL